nr:hypothetical protein [Tanacetum cinerariifolium]
MTDHRTMAEMLRAPTEGCAEAITVPLILAERFELKHSLINMMTSKQFSGLEKDNPYDHVWVARRWLEKEPPRSITTCSKLAKLTHAVNQQTSAVTTTMTAMLKQLQSNPPPAQVKAVEEICVTCGGAHPYYQCLAAGGNTFPEYQDNIQGYRPQGVDNQMRPPDMVKNELRNEMKTSIHTSLSNQTNEIKNMMASLLQMNTASTLGSGTLPGNTIANPKDKLKDITIRSGLVTDGPTVPNPPKSVNPKEDECVKETYTDPDHTKYTIKVPPPPVRKPKPLIQRNFVLHTRDSLPPYIPYPSRALVLMPKYQKMLKALLSNKEKLQELANTPLNENCSAVILKKLPEKLEDPGKTARALIDVHGEEMILRDGDERFTLNMKHDTTSYSNHPYRDSVNLINIFNLSSEDCLEDLVSNKQSGSPTFSLHKEIASPEVTHEINDSKGCNFLSEELPDIDSFNEIHSHFDDDPPSGSTTYSANSLLEEFTDELALITYPLDYDDTLTCDIEDDVLPYPDNEDKVFNPGILSLEKSVKIITRVTQVKKLAVSFSSLLFEDFDPPISELLVFKEVPNSMRFSCFQSQSDFLKPDEDFSCSKWKEYSSFGCFFVPFLSPLIRSSMGEFGPAHLTLNKRFVGGTPCLSF